MAQISGVRTTSQTITTETRNIRQVDDKIALLEPNAAPLITFLQRLKKRRETASPRFEWYEDDYTAQWAVNGSDTIAAATTSTTITVTDGTLFTVGSMFTIPKAASSTWAKAEVIRVTGVSGNALTVVRNVGSNGMDTINPGDAIRIIAPAFEENSSVPTMLATSPVLKVGYTQISRFAVQISGTQANSATYGAPGGEREREHAKKLVELKRAMNSALLFGVSSEGLTSGPTSYPLRTSAGLINTIATNTTDAGGTLTRKAFEAFARQAFRYSSSANREKLLLACPLLKSAISQWATDFLIVKPGEKKYGVNVNQVETGHGVWLLVNDWQLESAVANKNGYANISLSVDVDNIEYRYMKGRDTRVTMDAVKNGTDGTTDLIEAEYGFQIKQEKTHALLYNLTDYQS